MKGDYKVSGQAEADLDAIWSYGLEKWGLVQADKYLAAFYDHFKQLAQQPLLYPVVGDARKGLRRSLCGVDSVYYRIDNKGVEIVRVLGRQDAGEMLR